MFDGMSVSATGMVAERLRMDTISANLANANSTRRADGTVGPYLRREVVTAPAQGNFGSMLQTSVGSSLGDFGDAATTGGPGGVQIVGVIEDPNGTGLKHDPGHPDADADGNVRTPNVNPVTEMADLITATRAYEANVTAMGSMKTSFMQALDVLKG